MVERRWDKPTNSNWILDKGERDSTRIYRFILVNNKVVIGYTAEKD